MVNATYKTVSVPDWIGWDIFHEGERILQTVLSGFYATKRIILQIMDLVIESHSYKQDPPLLRSP